MRLRPLLLTAVCLISACRMAGAAPLTEAERQELAPFQHLYVFDKDFWNKESERIAKTGGTVAKNGNRLTLKLAGGHSKTIDFTPCDDSGDVKMDTSTCSTYVLLAHLKSQNGYLLAEAHYEWLTFHWIDGHNGQQSKFENMPIFSPDARHIAIIDTDPHNSDTPGLTIIYERNGEDWTLIHREAVSFSGEEYYFLDTLSFAGWNANELTLIKKFSSRGGTPPQGFGQPADTLVKIRY